MGNEGEGGEAEAKPYLPLLAVTQSWKLNTPEDQIKVIATLPKLLGQYSYTSLERFIENFFGNVGSPLPVYESLYCKNGKPRKKQKLVQSQLDNTEGFLASLLLIMKFIPHEIYSLWDIKHFAKYLQCDNENLRWLSINCIKQLIQISESEARELIKIYKITNSVNECLSLKIQNELEAVVFKKNVLNNGSNNKVPSNEIVEIGQPNKGLKMLSIGGLIVESIFITPSANSLKICQLPSSVETIREITLSTLSTSAPICVCGPVGSGKTLLLQYTAALFSRQNYPNIISVQMSDQIDSKLLLGSYHSTDLPGQFVWKPGCLTKAVINGYWIIFEDLEAASSDVLTLLNGLIENQKLSVPCYGQINKIHPDFRMFSTCRTQIGRRTDKLRSSWRNVILNHVSNDELKFLLSDLFPHLTLISDRLLDMYTALIEANGSSQIGRIISLRDFVKFCRRIPATLEFAQPHSAILLFQEGFDLFASSIRSPEKRLMTSEVIGVHMNLLKAKAEYFCSMYKPNLMICHNTNNISCGRFTLKMINSLTNSSRDDAVVFSLTKRASCLVEMICGCVKFKEPVLLTGETGVGKTSCVQYLAKILKQKLIVVNLNRQSDSSDLLGGYKPVELKYIFGPIREEFEALFQATFDLEANSKFLTHIMTCYVNRRWKDLLKLMLHVENSALARVSSKKNKYPANLSQRWIEFSNQLARINLQMQQGEESPFAFSFIEGSLINAIKNGYWILLDEINLATPEMLQCLYGIIDEHSSINLWERGDESPVTKHANFHLFAAMNPATDVGKKDLPLGLRNRFTEFYVPELTDQSELQMLVSDYLREMSLSSSQIEKIVEFYLTIRNMAESSLVDGSGKKPLYSLRTLCRALKISTLCLYGSISRSLYESFSLSFLTQLNRSSHATVQALIARCIIGISEIKSILNHALPCPKSGDWIKVEGYWLCRGDNEPVNAEKYILTASIRKNLGDLARIVSAGKLPVLIQGETSVGKTSLVQYLAGLTGNRCYRINNHQHTDLQEYVGSYQSDESGKLVFTEGVLVQAMRKGEWIILDELNLAPSEVLEALNRVLDDNRQLFITETGQIVNAHPRFMLFATQNPPGFYGGRKLLSRAFRNRFVELHFDEIPSQELEQILHLRCDIPQSYCKKIIKALHDLQVRRKASAALEGKHGFATLRDLFRWAERYRLSGQQSDRFYDWDQHLADEGYLVLAGKVRKAVEADVIREVLQLTFKRTIDIHNMFTLHEKTSAVTRPILEKVMNSKLPEFQHIVWTFQLRRIAVLIAKAIQFSEPTLLVGETGCGKTTIVQLLCNLFGQKLYSVNCHMNSESSDFIGGLRPVREHVENSERLFEWVNGPLIESMQNGGLFLVDEISLADDSVLERINSVLEPERTILVSEKGDGSPSLIKAHDKFQFVGTMNPGGDYGKKELSPALRNRLTEIWCEVSSEAEDLEAIIEHNLDEHLKRQNVGKIMISFVTWIRRNDLGLRWTISIRDYLAWTKFVNHVCSSANVSLKEAVYHGACLVLLDGIGTFINATENSSVIQKIRTEALAKLLEISSGLSGDDFTNELCFQVQNNPSSVGIGQFSIAKNKKLNSSTTSNYFTLEAPTTSQNGLRFLRALQLNKPILLEGSPGVGKTALVSVIAKLAGFPLVRINLSEQTDISDLFGADLPVEGKEGGHFAWRDGPLLQALKTSSWILLDELNLASQSVLEGLNACLDHRGEIYVPELNRTFNVSQESNYTRIIGCQNPLRQGGARKGLPKSFLNRFTQVYMDSLTKDDLKFIICTIYPEIATSHVEVMTCFADSVTKAICQLNLFGIKGSPWDFNLRDLIRWCDLLLKEKAKGLPAQPGLFVDLIYGKRMRTLKDEKRMLQLFYECEFQNSNIEPSIVRCGSSGFFLNESAFICGNGCLPRENISQVESFSDKQLLVLDRQLPALEGLAVCLENGWMPILVGPSGSGKTSLIKLLSEITGHSLQVMTVSPEMDTMELLGGFEQADIYRKIDEWNVDFCKTCLSMVQSTVCHKTQFLHSDDDLDMIDLQILDFWSSFRSMNQLKPDSQSTLSHEEEEAKIKKRVELLDSMLNKCKSFLVEKKKKILVNVRSSGTKDKKKQLSSKFLDQMDISLEKAAAELDLINSHLTKGIHTGGFQWVDSLLIKAITNGDWLLIDGANKCSASVLDRLNPLVEPNGTLFLSERGSIDGAIKEIKPHPEFRLILAMDPAYGEISRAMRNRGVEIFMPDPDDIFFKEDDDENLGSNLAKMNQSTVGRILNTSLDGKELTPAKVLDGIKLLDLDSLLRSQGCYDASLRKSLINLHEEIEETITSSFGIQERPNMNKLVNVVESVFLMTEHGMTFSDAIRNALFTMYLKGNSRLDESNSVRVQIESSISNFVQNVQLIDSPPRLPLVISNFISSQTYRIWHNMDILIKAMESPCPMPVINDLILNVKGHKWDLLIESIFSSIFSEDALLFAKLIEQKLPKYADLALKLANVIVEYQSLVKGNPWDFQWYPHLVQKLRNVSSSLKLLSIVKTSLLINKTHLIVDKDFEWKAKSLGTLAKNISEGKFTDLRNSDFFALLFSLVNHFGNTLKQALGSSKTTVNELSNEFYPELWKNGIITLFWYKRLLSLTNVTWNPTSSDGNERLLSNITLVLQWIHKQVIPFLQDISISTSNSTLPNVLSNSIQKCLNAMDENNEAGTISLMSSSEDVKSFQEIVATKPFFVLEKQKVKWIEEIIELCLAFWSLPVQSDELIHFIYSNEGVHCHFVLCELCTKVYSGENFTEDDYTKLSNLKAKLNSIQKTTVENQMEIDEQEEELHQRNFQQIEANGLKKCLFALKEYIRICYSHKNSSFVSPILVIHNLFDSKSFIRHYFEWEDIERYSFTFMQGSNTSGESLNSIPKTMSNLLPALVADILLENNNNNNGIAKSLRSCTLGLLENTRNSIEELNSILSQRMLANIANEEDKLSVSAKKKHFIELLHKIKIVMGENWERDNIEQWLNILESSDETDNENKQRIILGTVMIQLGASLIQIAANLPLVDPSVEKEILSEYIKEEISFFRSWILSQRIRMLLDNGTDLMSLHKDQVHPFVIESALHINFLEKLLKETETGIAQRSDPPKYTSIRKEIHQFTQSYGNPKKLYGIISSIADLQNNSTDFNQDQVNSLKSQLLLWIDGHRNFVTKLSKLYWYWDITAGYLFASKMVTEGLSFFYDSISSLQAGMNSLKMRTRLLKLSSFPIPFGSSGALSDSRFVHERSLKSDLTTYLNQIETEKYLSNSIITRVHKISKEITRIWKHEEIVKEKKKELEDAMYVFKGKERNMELSEEEQEKLDLKRMFPNFENDFGKLIEQPLDHVMEISEENDVQQYVSESLDADIIRLFLKIHQRIVSMIKNHWIGSQMQDEFSQDFISPFLKRFELTCTALSNNYWISEKLLEEKFVLGAKLAASQISSGKHQSEFFKPTALYDFYHDPNIEEVEKIRPIFNGLRKRVMELLCEWPEHPALTKILEVMDRIESFKVDASVMKFLTGLELLLGSAQEWESCAHHGVSIANFLAEITDMIINWRKLELHCWKNLLEIILEREQSETHKWWFHLFSTITELKSMGSAKEFLESLKQFIESSPIGQFETRLSYIYNFHCLVLLMEESECKQIVLAYTWNIFNFYKQFSSTISNKLVSLRSPIEKKLKDFIKISRWNDANFYALKDSVLKSQKTLIKLVKEWKKVLQTPVKSFLVNESDKPLSKSIKNQFKPLRPALYLTPATWKMKMASSNNELIGNLKIKRLGKLPKLYDKIQSLTRIELDQVDIVSEVDIVALNDLNGNIIDTVHELESLQAPSEEMPEKRKKTLHNIHFRKRTALADLFKVLQQHLNLSYRRGLMSLKNVSESFILYDFSIEPIDLIAGWKHLNYETPVANEELIGAWFGCEQYFQKSITRTTAMQKCFQSPSKELGPTIIERCKGFVGDLLSITIDQKVVIANFSKLLWTLRLLTQQNVGTGGINQLVFKEVYHGICTIEYSTKQYIILIDSISDKDYLESKVNYKNSLNEILQKCEHVKYLIKNYVDDISIIEDPIFQDADEILTECLENIEDIKSKYKLLEEANSILGHSFQETRKEIEHISTNIINIEDKPQNQTELNSKQMRKYEKQMNLLLQKILLTFQKLNKQRKSVDLENPRQESYDSEQLSDMRDKFTIEINTFDIEKITTLVASITNGLQKKNCPLLKEVFNKLVPLIKQYAMLGQFYLTLLVSFHRGCCKLLSTLAGLFTNLATKGFCLPADYEDQAAEEGEEMDAQAGMGLGAGDSSSDAKDVSDRIESEDQLEDTLQEGETIESADKDLKDDDNGVEMSDDFEGKQQDKERHQNGEEESDSDEKSDGEENELDKEMGDIGGEDENNLDEQMWGGSSDEDEDDLNEGDDSKGSKTEQSEPQLAAKDPNLEETSKPEDQKEKNETQQQPKEFNEQSDEEVDDNQVDPYHGQNEPEPEVEPMDLPDDLNLDDAQEREGNNDEENPFDLDNKENEEVQQNLPEEEKDELPKDENQLSDNDDDEEQKAPQVDSKRTDLGMDESSEGEDTEETQATEEIPQEEENMDTLENEENRNKESNKQDEQKTDQQPEPAQDNEKTSTDRTPVPNPLSNDNDNLEQAMDDPLEDNNMNKNDETASGQVESQDGSGHEGKNIKEKLQSSDKSKQEKESSRKPGKSDENRSLRQDLDKQKSSHRLKTVQDSKQNEEEMGSIEEEETNEGEKNSDLFQHIRDSEKSDASTIDHATKDQAEKDKSTENEKLKDEEKIPDQIEDMEEVGDSIDDDDDVEIIESEKSDQVKGIPTEGKKSENEAKSENVELPKMNAETDGDIIQTFGVQRPLNSTIETRFDLLEEWSKQKNIETLEAETEKLQIRQTVLSSEEEIGALTEWHELESRTLHLSQELCEQLRLILEPTQASRLKGDYKTGKRLNMRKVIPYIASGFRKDKIWLRRTQPSKREYQILLALDDSASMSDNQSKQMAFSAVAVVAKSLGLLEAGQLAVSSFGEDVQLLHGFDEPFSDFSGARLIQRFTFCQRRTRIAQLLDSSLHLFTDARQNLSPSAPSEVAQLLLIISDGRNISNEGTEVVNKAVRRIREQNIFVVFIIVDNPENSNSVLDIQLPIFDKNGLVRIEKYMDSFPFPFYLLLRDLSALPTVLSDALRQWFELVTSCER